MSFWNTLGGDVKKLFGFVASPTGQKVIAIGEGVVETAFPQATVIINSVNKWMSKAIEVEGLAEVAGQSKGNGAVKADIVLSTISPVVIADMKAAGLPEPTTGTLATVNDKVVEILNLLTAQTKPTVEPAPAPGLVPLT